MIATASRITNHTQLLNYLIRKHNFSSYLEIGINNPENNFNKVICKRKIGVDPEVNYYTVEKVTSDDFFEFSAIAFDLIFIDGLHHADQVKRDFENSLNCLTQDGFIVIHDTLPEQEVTTCVPRGNQKVWHGDVYRFAMTLGNYAGINFFTINMDNGCTIVRKVNKTKKPFDLPMFKVDWNGYLQHRHSFMNIIPPTDIEKYL